MVGWHRCLPANPGMPGMLAAAPHSMKGLTFKSKRKLKQKHKQGIICVENLTKTKQRIKKEENYLASRGYPPRRSLCLRCVKTAKETRVNFVVVLLKPKVCVYYTSKFKGC